VAYLRGGYLDTAYRAVLAGQPGAGVWGASPLLTLAGQGAVVLTAGTQDEESLTGTVALARTTGARVRQGLVARTSVDTVPTRLTTVLVGQGAVVLTAGARDQESLTGQAALARGADARARQGLVARAGLDLYPDRQTSTLVGQGAVVLTAGAADDESAAGVATLARLVAQRRQQAVAAATTEDVQGTTVLLLTPTPPASSAATVVFPDRLGGSPRRPSDPVQQFSPGALLAPFGVGVGTYPDRIGRRRGPVPEPVVQPSPGALLAPLTGAGTFTWPDRITRAPGPPTPAPLASSPDALLAPFTPGWATWPDALVALGRRPQQPQQPPTLLPALLVGTPPDPPFYGAGRFAWPDRVLGPRGLLRAVLAWPHAPAGPLGPAGVGWAARSRARMVLGHPPAPSTTPAEVTRSTAAVGAERAEVTWPTTAPGTERAEVTRPTTAPGATRAEITWRRPP